MRLCAFLGQHGAICVPGGGERGVGGCKFEAQPAAMLQRGTRLEHTAAQLGGRSCREQVGRSSDTSFARTETDKSQSLCWNCRAC